jgi:hypothetical protein
VLVEVLLWPNELTLAVTRALLSSTMQLPPGSRSGPGGFSSGYINLDA